jgi:hypothetical protein
MRPYFEKKPHHIKRAGGGAQGVGLEFKPQYHKINKYTEGCIVSFMQMISHFI